MYSVKNKTKKPQTYIDACGRLLYRSEGLIMQIIGIGKDGWNLKFRK
jgi:hypothetical protein